MGNRSSKPVDDFAELIHKSRSAQDKDKSYTRDEILEGLKVVAEYLHSKRLDVSLITVGGAVNTVLLDTRTSTGDVDIFYRTKVNETKLVNAVLEGGKRAEATLGLSSQWLNNHTVVFMEEGLMNDLYARAIQQNRIVFRASGLTLYAAPWDYSMMAKLDRAAKPGAKVYDIKDAADYLHQFIEYDGRTTRRQHVTKAELRAWAARWKLSKPTDDVIHRLAVQYQEEYKREGVVN